MTKSAILFSKDHVKSIEFDHRIPPNSIGARRTRPSSKEVMNELKRQKRAKKEEKGARKEEEKLHTNGALDMQMTVSTAEQDTVDEDLHVAPGSLSGHSLSPFSSMDDQSKHNQQSKTVDNQTPTQYYQFTIDSQLIQEEIDEIKGVDRAAFNNLPALLTAPMTEQAYRQGLLPHLSLFDGAKERNNISLDDDLACQWAMSLRTNMKNAEATREKEDMRPMAYRLVPETWSRLRSSCATPENSDECQNESENPNNELVEGDNSGKDGDRKSVV